MAERRMAADLAVVVVHWNVPALLERCLRSLATDSAAAGLTVEVVVVDTGSPDATYRAVVQRAAARLIEMPDNPGYAAGCNAGVAATDSAAVLLLNADVEVVPGALAALWQGLHVAAHIGMVAPLLLNADGSVQSAGYRFPGLANVAFDLFPAPARLIESPLNGRMPVGDGVQPMRIDYPLGAAMMLPRGVLEQVGGLDEGYGMYAEEIDLAQKLAALDLTTLLIPRARVIHYGGQSTAQRAVAMHEALWSSRALYAERWQPKRRQRAIGALTRLGLLLDDRRGDDARRAANARLRARYARLGRS
jgi:N-acetylglucosaminyl-diphospho-decaprenol L-rhamnosyltransferase